MALEDIRKEFDNKPHNAGDTYDQGSSFEGRSFENPSVKDQE